MKSSLDVVNEADDLIVGASGWPETYLAMAMTLAYRQVVGTLDEACTEVKNLARHSQVLSLRFFKNSAKILSGPAAFRFFVADSVVSISYFV